MDENSTQEVTQATDAATQATKAPITTPAHDKNIDVLETKFMFRTDPATVTAENKEGYRRPTFTLPVRTLSIEGIVAILEGDDPAQLELLKSAVYDVIYNRYRELVAEDTTITADNFPYEKATWAAIAALPKGERSGGAIAKETWDAFAKDYLEVVPAATGKDESKVALVAKILVAKLNPLRFAPDKLQAVKNQLATYTTASPNAGDFTQVIEYLNARADGFIKAGIAGLDDAL